MDTNKTDCYTSITFLIIVISRLYEYTVFNIEAGIHNTVHNWYWIENDDDLKACEHYEINTLPSVWIGHMIEIDL